MTPLRILVAEDNLINQKVVSHMLQKLGYQADFVGDGTDAVTAARERRYDVVFMDVMMPTMDGIEAAGLIRATESPGHRACIIALTANALGSDRARCLAAGMDDYISKPFMLETLKEKLGVYLETRTFADPIDQTLFSAFVSMMGDDDPVFIRELLSDFATDSDRLHNEMITAMSKKDAVKLRATFHTLRSTALVFGAVSLSQLCGRLETAAIDGNLSDIEENMERLDSELRGVQTQLNTLMDQRLVTTDGPPD